MNKYLKQLVELSEVDNNIGAFEPKIAKENEKLSFFVDSVKKLEDQIDALNTEIEDTKSNKIKNEIHIAEQNDKLEDISRKMADIETDKELKALQVEESIAKEQINIANDEIERLENLAQTKQEEIDELEEELEEERGTLAQMQEVINQKVSELQAQRDAIFAKRGDLVVDIDNKILVFYDKIRRWAKNSAVVPVKKQACYGCYLKINDKVYAEVIKSEEIVTCHHCGRILYLDSTSEDTK